MDAPRDFVYATFSPQYIARRLQTDYGLRAPRCELYQRGLNDTYRIADGEHDYALRIYHAGWRTRSQVDAELEIIRLLSAHGVAAAQPVARRDAEWITVLDAPEGTRYAVLLQWAPGEEPQYADHRHAAMYGAVAARLHEASDAVELPSDRPRLDLSAILEPIVSLRGARELDASTRAYFEGLAARLRAVMSSANTQALDWGFCHGDLHCGNALLADGRLTLIDFDCCGPGWRAFDLATFRWAARLRQKEDVAWMPFLDAYSNIRPVSQRERELIPVFVILRALWLLGVQASRVTIEGAAMQSRAYFRQYAGFCRAVERDHPSAFS